ncbi:helix-turn-helix domain-containing protein [Flammeovirga sp. SJP92]|uniref:helix-turn-helix domain-containing protein n=1 Tax=Flammeovirga sp. SJP92 TaxID=1775430 RepID=UPI000787627C|nr:helix-turn-helix transcriptional regulator [Flammeovirga sp. SJP92]KXX72755.1 hypothetical protein AVL50_32155 [Flammeovirga sp. SJP92]
MIDTGKVLRDIRTSLKLTQEEFATKIGKSQKEISRWELNGIPVQRLNDIAKSFNLDLKVIIENHEQRNS